MFVHVLLCAVALTGTDGASLRQLVQRDRLLRRGGVAAGAALVAGAGAVGAATGVIDPAPLLPLACLAGLAAAGALGANHLSNQEARSPLRDDQFTVRASSPGKGDGLFAVARIAAETYLFDYEGERLDEAAFFERYPSADGRYIACLTDNLYIDGADVAASNLARFMNHASPSAANVRWTKQRLGLRPAM